MTDRHDPPNTADIAPFRDLQQSIRDAVGLDFGIYGPGLAPFLPAAILPPDAHTLLAHYQQERRLLLFDSAPRVAITHLEHEDQYLILVDHLGSDQFEQKIVPTISLIDAMGSQWSEYMRILRSEQDKRIALEGVMTEQILYNTLYSLFNQQASFSGQLTKALGYIGSFLQVQQAELTVDCLTPPLHIRWQKAGTAAQKATGSYTQPIQHENMKLGTLQVNPPAGQTDGFSLQIQMANVCDVLAPIILHKSTEQAMQRDIEQTMRTLAWYDPITGLRNRACFDHDLSAILQKGDAQGCVIMLDIDRFRSINETFGHEVGDELLRKIGQYLSSIPGLENRAYYFNSDRFLLLLDQYSYKRSCAVIARIRRRFRSVWELGGNSQYCTMGGGTVSYPSDGKSVGILLRNVDIALNTAKLQGSNTFIPFYESDDKKHTSRLHIENALRRAVMSDCPEFEIYYQPLVNIHGEAVSAEALLRWNSPTLGMVLPSDFIPIAEYLGLITTLGEHVLRTACAQCVQWHQMGRDDMSISVNLSLNQIYDPNFVSHVQSILHATKLPANHLVLEVTETMAITDGELMNERLSQLRKLGVRIALDDFGTGYSSINCLKSLPLDVIKIDRSFIREMVTDSYYREFIRSIIDLSHSAGHKVCCEGIEESGQHDMLRDLSCDMMQGYYFGKPMTGEAFTDLLFD